MGRKYILEGGGLRQLALAWRLRRAGDKVLLLVPESYLGQEICKPHRYEFNQEPVMLEQEPAMNLWREWTQDTWERQGVLHPDRLKCRLEDWCREKGIDYEYMLGVLEAEAHTDGTVTVRTCGKSGMTEWVGDVFLAKQEIPEQKDSFAVHLWRETEPENSARMLYVSVDRKKAEGAFYEEAVEKALEAFAARRKKDPSLCLGRFGEEGFDSNISPEIYIREGLKDFERLEELCAQEKATETVTKQYDLIVAGGGTAGAMAALYGARNGCRVLLAEQNSVLGGTATAGGVSTYWFGERFREVEEIDRLTGEWEDRYQISHPKLVWSEFDRFHPGIRAMVLEKLNRESGVEILKEAFVYDVEMDGDGAVHAITIRTKQKILKATAKYVIDATGDGDVAVLAKAAYSYGSERDYVTYWASLAQYCTPGTYKNNFSSSFLLEDPQSLTDFIRLGRRRGKATYDHGAYVAQRESRHIRGKKTVTLKDVVSFRCWEDGIYTCFSNYDPKGKLSSDMIYAGVLPPQNCVQIPLGACIPVDWQGKKIGGLLVAGKAISCTRGAFPGLRMQTDLMHQGAVLGMLAALAIRSGMEAEELPVSEVRKKIQEMSGDMLKMPGQKVNLDQAVKKPCDLRKHWIDMSFEKREETESGSLALMCAEQKEALPVLEKAWEALLKEERTGTSDSGMQRREKAELAGYLLWHGSDLGTDSLLEEMNRELDEAEGLPLRSGSMACAQLLPDHGVMTEFTYRLNLLAWSGKKEILPLFERVFERLQKQERDYENIQKGIYHYVEAFAYVGERTGFLEFIPWLLALAELPEFEKAWENPENPDILTQRFLILRMLLYRAGARMKDNICMEKLQEMTCCKDHMIALSAKKELGLIRKGAGRITEKEW